jgi:hypothetical protein
MLRPYAVQKLHKRIHDVITFARHVVQSMTGNPDFPAPTPPLASVEAHIDALADAQSNVLSRSHGAAARRDACLMTVRFDLGALRSYVQTLANRVDAVTAAQLIASSGFSVKRSGVHPRQTASATPGPVSGSVKLTAPFAAKRAAYQWRCSEGSGPWAPLAETIRASTRIDSLTPGRVYRFQVRALTPEGVGDWSEPVAFLAL